MKGLGGARDQKKEEHDCKTKKKTTNGQHRTKIPGSLNEKHTGSEKGGVGPNLPGVAG